MAEFLRFCLVGLLGFMVDAGLLELLVAYGLPAAFARVGSITVALQFTYFVHGTFTYRAHAGYNLVGWARFMASNALGGAINYTVFVALLAAPLGTTEQTSRLLALFAGTGLALLFNYWANRRFAFAHKEP
jgi:putative flippase GtrA